MQTISRDELLKKIENNDDFVLLDVLPNQHYKDYHLPKAINVPVGEDFAHNVQKHIPDKEKEIVVYCLDKECDASPKAAEELERLGYKNVYDYVHGKVDWKSSGLPVA